MRFVLLAIVALAVPLTAEAGPFRSRSVSTYSSRTTTTEAVQSVAPVAAMPATGQTFGQLLALHNRERAALGLMPLQLDPRLCSEAQASAAAQAIRGRVGHFLPLSAGGENAAAGQTTEEWVHRSWMNSPGHRGNVLSRSYSSVGFGLTWRGGVAFWAARFR